jgi:hypothetical protein
MRILTVIVPIIAYFVTWEICRELQGVEGGGKRKRANVVTLTPEGEYLAVPAPESPNDEVVELEPEPVPLLLESGAPEGGNALEGGEDAEPTGPGVRTVSR